CRISVVLPFPSVEDQSPQVPVPGLRWFAAPSQADPTVAEAGLDEAWRLMGVRRLSSSIDSQMGIPSGRTQGGPSREKREMALSVEVARRALKLPVRPP